MITSIMYGSGALGCMICLQRIYDFRCWMYSQLWHIHSLQLFSQVAGIKGMFLANKKMNTQIKTHITYNRGRDWRILQAPSKDLRGNSIHCLLVSVHQRGLDGSSLIPAATRGWAQKEHHLSNPSALRQLWWKVSHFNAVQKVKLSFQNLKKGSQINRATVCQVEPFMSSW